MDAGGLRAVVESSNPILPSCGYQRERTAEFPTGDVADDLRRLTRAGRGCRGAAGRPLSKGGQPGDPDRVAELASCVRRAGRHPAAFGWDPGNRGSG